ncbi:hypothetical protein DQ04_00511030 [Trypanosoma grayi]|uniref:hypothetical protein n=1 Tax=Trypanosoma grayi TaxID=71804 RepID=UPI0004F43A18|nr:hypothetical protein DQ04_00511030 [Trypanosoma grayi]KEG14340.1 hypothetical protein DQ04_00511030 [Trypanosoma grayi]
MEPLIRPLPREEPLLASRRAVLERTRRQHAGTLNIFATQEPPTPAAPRIARQRAHHNYESQETREFAFGHLHRVKPPQRVETPRGIHHVAGAVGNMQSIQVVSITDAYKDPNNMPTPRAGLRCATRSHSSSMREILSYAGGSDEMRPISRPPSRVVNYSQQERFCQAVRDHAQHRRGGVTGFYVNLARGRVGRVSAHTPVETPRGWRLEDEPPTHTLTLGSCRDQLQSLTGIDISLAEMAELLWDADDLRAAMGGSVDEARLCELKVSYRDFSAAFGDNSANTKLATMKI